MRTLARLAILTLCGSVVLLGLPGCQYSYPFEVRGVVRSSSTGAPMNGVRVVLRTQGPRWIDKDGKRSLVAGDDGSILTTEDGAFLFRFEAEPGPEETWQLELSRSDHEEETCAITAGTDTSSGLNRIFVLAYLRPKN